MRSISNLLLMFAESSTEPMYFYSPEVWSFIVVLAVILGAVMLGNFLRRMFPVFRRMLLPSSVIAGFLVLLIGWAYKAIFGVSMLDTNILAYITYHGLGLGFIALTLRISEKVKNKNLQRDIFDTGVSVVATYLLQGVAGLAITLGLSYLISNVFAVSGMLLPMGYGQGPAQALTWGTIYQNDATRPFANGASFGLTVSAMGFIAASIGGVIYLRGMQKKGRLKLVDNDTAEVIPGEAVSAKGDIPMSESVDKLTMQIALVFIAYGIGYGIMAGLRALFLLAESPAEPGFLLNTVDPLIWGFSYLFGTVVAMGIRASMEGMRKKGVIKKQYINNFLLNRVSGFVFDIMVVASIAAIDLSAFTHVEFILPLAIICIVGTVITYWYNKYICDRLFKGYGDEMFLALFGMLTGTLSTGVVLLREADPGLETPTASNLVYESVWAIAFGFPMLLLMGFVNKPICDFANGWAFLSLGIMIILLVVMNLILFRSRIFGKKGTKQAKTEEIE